MLKRIWIIVFAEIKARISRLAGSCVFSTRVRCPVWRRSINKVSYSLCYCFPLFFLWAKFRGCPFGYHKGSVDMKRGEGSSPKARISKDAPLMESLKGQPHQNEAKAKWGHGNEDHNLYTKVFIMMRQFNWSQKESWNTAETLKWISSLLQLTSAITRCIYPEVPKYSWYTSLSREI